MTCRCLSTLLTALAILLVAPAAPAIPVLWTFQGSGFSDGQPLSGSFVYDEDIGTYSDVSISAGGFFAPGAFGSVDDEDPLIYLTTDVLVASSLNSNISVGRIDMTDVPDNCASAACQRTLFLFFLDPLTDAGGTVFVDTSNLGSYEFMSNDFNGDFVLREVASGSLIGVPLCVDPDDADCDGLSDAIDLCPFFSSPDQADADMNGIGDRCECGDQTGDGLVNVADILAINDVIFELQAAGPLCDTNEDGLCNVADILGVNAKIFGAPAYCARYPSPGP